MNCNENSKCARCTGNLVPSNDGSACVTCPVGCSSCDAKGNCLSCTDPNKKVGVDGKTCVDCAAKYC